MNVLHLIDTTGPGGAETIFIELASRSRHAGSPAVLIRGPGWVHDQLLARGLQPVIADCKGSFNWRFLLTLVNIIKRQSIDLIHAHLLGSNVYASLAGAITRRPVVSTFHGAVDISPNERLASVKFGAIRRYSNVVAVSEELQRDVATRLKAPLTAVQLIPNAINCEQFRAATPLPLREELGITPQTRLIGALGNIRPAKDYPNALRAMAALRTTDCDVALVIAGHPKEPLMSELKALRAELGLQDRVHFLGFLETPERYLASLDFFLLSSRSEGHPLALTQAMAAGVPIVATRCGVERIISPDMAWLVASESPEALAEGIRAAVTDETASRAKAEAAQHYAFAHFDFDAAYQRYLELYQRLTS